MSNLYARSSYIRTGISRKNRSKLALAAASVAVGVGVAWLTPNASAAVRTWNGGGTTNDWSDAGNWGGTAPISGDGLVFSGNVRLSNTNTITGLSVAGGTIAAGSGSFDLTGNQITLTADFNQLSTNAQTIDLPIILSGTRIFTTQGNTNGTLTLNGVLSGSGGFTKGNGGVASIILTAANTYTGATSIQANNPGALILSGLGSATSSSSWTPAGGALILDNSGTAVNDRIGNSSGVALQASTFALIGNDATAVGEVTGALTVSSTNPLSTITVDPRGSGASITFASGNIQTGSGLLIRAPGLGTTAGAGVGQVKFTTVPHTSGTGAAGSTSTPILTGVIVDSSLTGTGTDFAAYDATNGVRPLTAAEYATDLTTPGVNNVKLSAAPVAPLSGTAAVNALLLTNGGYSVDLGGNALTVVSGNLFADSTSLAPRTIANGTLTFTSSANGARVINNGGTLDLAVGQINNGGSPLVFLGSGTTTVEAKISGTGGLNVENPGGRVVLSASSDYTGSTAITTNGQLQFAIAQAAASNAFGASGTVTISPGGALELTGGITLPNNFITTGAGPGSQGVIRSLSGTNTITGNITMQGGAGSSNYQSDAGSLLVFTGSVTANTTTRVLNIQGAGDGLISGQIVDGAGANVLSGVSKTGSGTWTFSATNNAYSGQTLVNGGVFRAVDGASLPSGSAANGGKASNLKINAGVFETSGVLTRALGTATNQVQVTAGTSGFSAHGGTAIIDLGGDGSGTGPAAGWGLATFAPSTLVLNEVTADSLLDFRSAIDLRGTNTSLTRFINVNSPTAPAMISGAITNSGTGLASLTKAGVGTLILSGNAQYNGNLTVNAGAVMVNGTLGATTTNSVTVNVGGTLGGNGGVITSGVTLSSGGGTLSPGMNGSNAASQSAGVLTVGTLAFSGTNDAMIADLVASSGSGAASLSLAGTNYDSVIVSRATAVSGSGVALTLDDAGYARQFGDQFFLIRGASGATNNSLTFKFAGATLADGTTFDTDASGVGYRINYNVVDPVTGGKDVVLTVVPEPASLGLLAVAALGLAGRRRRRRAD